VRKSQAKSKVKSRAAAKSSATKPSAAKSSTPKSSTTKSSTTKSNVAKSIAAKSTPTKSITKPTIVYDKDVEMASELIEAQEASHAEGGTLHGRAQGNALKMADASISQVTDKGSMAGKVALYTSRDAGASVAMTMTHEVTPHLLPIFMKLVQCYLPV
jgi:hypothetical protein